MSEELKAAYQRIDELELALVTARSQIATLGGAHSDDSIQQAVLNFIDSTLEPFPGDGAYSA